MRVLWGLQARLRTAAQPPICLQHSAVARIGAPNCHILAGGAHCHAMNAAFELSSICSCEEGATLVLAFLRLTGTSCVAPVLTSTSSSLLHLVPTNTCSSDTHVEAKALSYDFIASALHSFSANSEGIRGAAMLLHFPVLEAPWPGAMGLHVKYIAKDKGVCGARGGQLILATLPPTKDELPSRLELELEPTSRLERRDIEGDMASSESDESMNKKLEGVDGGPSGGQLERPLGEAADA
eukprot:CAMPEP_0117687728 /NCGR_PEP_ID=MMETSP0804-20121206/23325_1 /TAXON_ID=1074897 /ORGANISM="Tetraselmis astigmatica, Strain CCMP880" /LENGTH=238 /DNA_ID=CAMNT_0005499881 /DNA_START=879 /DNA_END=1597 /DNA_ORIENTATION=+